MAQRVFFSAVGILYVILGVGNLMAPSAFMSGFGLSFDASGDLVARVLGSAAVALGIICWACRDAAPSRLFAAVLYGNLIEKVLQVILVLYAVNAGVFNSMGWAMLVLQLLLGIGFAYFAFRRPAAGQAGA